MKRREFCRQFAIVGGAIVLSPLIKSCAPDVDPMATSDGWPPTTAPPRDTMTPQPSQPTATTAVANPAPASAY